ncbi:MAG: SpoIIE family protein phosphatase [Bacteroidaceae bacterium]|nr:SpoIIE family protein phosphatase [Bacteroidaceae bacterium]
MNLLQLASRSVALRTTLYVFLLTALIMTGMNYIESSRVYDAVASEMLRQAGRAMDGVVADIDSRVSNVETAVETAAAFADRTSRHETQCYEMLYRLISKNYDIAAVTLLYRENFFPQMGRYYAPTVVRNPISGELEPNEIGGPVADFCYLETDSNWIYTNLLRDGYWCLPYSDSISTKRAMVTYSVPLFDDADSIYAVLCADVALDWVRDVVEDAKPYDFSHVVVISRDSQYVCHPNPAWIQTLNVVQHAEQSKDTSMMNVTDRMLSWQKGMDTLAQDFTTYNSTRPEEKERTIVFYAPVPRVQWSVSFTLPESRIMEGPRALSRSMTVMFFLMLLLTSVSLFMAIHHQLKPLKDLAVAVRYVSKGHFDHELPKIKTNDEIRHLRDAFVEMQTSLSTYIDELQTTTASKAQIENELRVASAIQMAMLPKIFPPYPERDDINIFGALTPAKAVGGDLYDFYIRDEKLFFCIGDVSGKGIPASLVMAVTRALFRTISNHEARPDYIAAQINNALSEENDSNMFVTLFIGVLDLPSGRLRYCNAGHDAPMLLSDHTEMLPCDSNVPAGVMPGWKFQTQETTIAPPTTLFLYTDGLTEAENAAHQLFGERRMRAVGEQAVVSTAIAPDPLIELMTDAVHAFVGDAEQSDDLTMLAIQYTKAQRDEKQDVSITLPNDIQAVPQLAEFVEQVCETAGFDMATTMQLNLAIEEAVVNVMNYAYPAGAKGEILVQAKSNDVRLKFTITDSGAPFDPTARKEVDTTLSAEERSIGGLGIHLMRQIMDSINYERLNGQNVLTLRKKLTVDS